ncbi:hypothetical protein BCV69DRAFT_285126 [Microstroma glucosiphilum]|uniref:Eukaryotic translation initiation factor 3 subunit M n=1 Tax=Pseudomicrostroma glucosiphilum TaxID=1684307 RepID=A0A316TZ76_9BASI|nr:hypothetical protein BCV69DRAFT_285126 [Pseudomicrostroma glucosiphilum]PWN18496.1 hypothetical protein BCV69DRAFT_285126 [Pseudomicrostroma glucosiphilum]
MSSIVLSDSSLADQALDIAALVSRSKPEAERSDYINSWSTRAAEAGEDQAKRDEVVQALAAEVKTLGDGTERELEGAHNLLSAMILSVADAETSQKLAEQHISAVISESGAASAASPAREMVKYRILSNIFNTLPSTSPLREKIFLSMLDLAASNDEVDLLSPALASLPTWLAQWSIPESQKAAALETVASKLESSGDNLTQKSYDFRLAHLTYLSTTPGAATSSEATKAAAEKTFATALSLPKIFEFDALLKLSAVESSLSSSSLFSLLKLLVQGSYQDWTKWIAEGSNASDLSRLQVDKSVVERKVRLLEVASLCSRAVEAAKSSSSSAVKTSSDESASAPSAPSSTAEVPYSQLSSAIDVPSSDVESWIIDVIRAGLISGKLSQVNQSLRVYRSTYRTFGREQWTLLEGRLQEWDRAIDGILATLGGATRGQVNGVQGSDAALVGA